MANREACFLVAVRPWDRAIETQEAHGTCCAPARAEEPGNTDGRTRRTLSKLVTENESLRTLQKSCSGKDAFMTDSTLTSSRCPADSVGTTAGTNEMACNRRADHDDGARISAQQWVQSGSQSRRERHE